MDNHLKLQDYDDQSITHFKQTIISEIKERFKLEWNLEDIVSVRQIASFLDPRYKNLDHEPIIVRESIRSSVIDLLNNTNVHNVNIVETQREYYHFKKVRFSFSTVMIVLKLTI